MGGGQVRRVGEEEPKQGGATIAYRQMESAAWVKGRDLTQVF